MLTRKTENVKEDKCVYDLNTFTLKALIVIGLILTVFNLAGSFLLKIVGKKKVFGKSPRYVYLCKMFN